MVVRRMRGRWLAMWVSWSSGWRGWGGGGGSGGRGGGGFGGAVGAAWPRGCGGGCERVCSSPAGGVPGWCGGGRVRGWSGGARRFGGATLHQRQRQRPMGAAIAVDTFVVVVGGWRFVGWRVDGGVYR